jgi:hypothetical protein
MNQTSLNQETLESVKIYVDASAPEFIRSLKVMVGEDDSPQYIKEQLDQRKKYDFNPADYMTVIPVSFNPEAQNMLIHTKELLEYESRPLIGINSKFDKLITALKTAVSNDMGRLNKEFTSYDDVLDAFRLALKHFRIKNKKKRRYSKTNHSIYIIWSCHQLLRQAIAASLTKFLIIFPVCGSGRLESINNKKAMKGKILPINHINI